MRYMQKEKTINWDIQYTMIYGYGYIGDYDEP